MHVSDMDLNAFVDLETCVWDALRRRRGGRRPLAGRRLPRGLPEWIRYPIGSCRTAHARSDGGRLELCDARLMVLSEDDVLLSYRADAHRLVDGQSGESETMFVSSLWCRRSGRWVNVFSQDSPSTVG